MSVSSALNFVFVLFFRCLDSELDDLSCTDVEQQWGTVRKSAMSEYEAKKRSEFCHAHGRSEAYAYQMPEVTEEMKKKWRDILVRCKHRV